MLDFSEVTKRTNDDDATAISNCFLFSASKGDPEFTISIFSSTQLLLSPVDGTIDSSTSEITMKVNDCFDFMSEEKANRMKEITLTLEKFYTESEEEKAAEKEAALEEEEEEVLEVL